MENQLPDGIYFDLPDEIYHAQHRIGSSKIKDLIISPATFWVGSWLNPDKKEKDAEHFAVGKAYHCARLEPDTFAARFVRGIDKADFDGPTTGTALNAEFKAVGLPAKKSSETVTDAAYRLAESGYEKPLYHIAVDEHEKSKGNRLEIKPETWDHIQRDMKFLQDNKEVSAFLQDGAAEVSFLWTTEAGLKMQVRFDYLTTTHFADFKTFANPSGKVLDQCISDAFRYNRYYIQAYLYWMATYEIRTGKHTIYVCEKDNILKSCDDLEMITKIRARKDPLEVVFVFQEKNGIPNLLAKKIEMFRNDVNESASSGKVPALSLVMSKARVEINHAIDVYTQCLEVFGTDTPWQSLQPVGTLTDLDFNPYWLDQ